MPAYCCYYKWADTDIHNLQQQIQNFISIVLFDVLIVLKIQITYIHIFIYLYLKLCTAIFKDPGFRAAVDSLVQKE